MFTATTATVCQGEYVQSQQQQWLRGVCSATAGAVVEGSEYSCTAAVIQGSHHNSSVLREVRAVSIAAVCEGSVCNPDQRQCSRRICTITKAVVGQREYIQPPPAAVLQWKCVQSEQWELA
eukprot:GHUV01019633.1.p2 GENE.GHUV01019633.1~~GHUV01019633.1.p2  ORF type:complete len:121 (-),score=40.70 GHUV01019633.1:1264-1626(-)